MDQMANAQKDFYTVNTWENILAKGYTHNGK